MVAPTAKLKTETSQELSSSVATPSIIAPSKPDQNDDEVLIEAGSVPVKPTQKDDEESEKPSQNGDDNDEDDIMISADDTNINTTTSSSSTSINNTTSGVTLDQDGRPKFSSVENSGERVKFDQRNVRVPPHRLTPLKETWVKIYEPLVNHLKLQVRMDLRKKEVQIRTCKKTTDPGAVQKGEDFLRAFMIGFDIDDAVALLRLNDLYTETFEVKDVKTLTGDHLSRAIGRIAGKDGKTKYAIENATRTRIVLANSKIHILGGFENVKIARETVVSLILGAPPGKIYGNLRIISSRLKERY
ncbi:uncharacterized protein SAPINGB_P004944 [Magnusiomyces paraingens]|uniref:Pre-rRNA-processing protein PNO1 n=1 Tax=Magnusiomyces paraingens TaxID=2606893 RepID=A0A5E8C089_9ASCO|nr:uncharacterized protein SAPINGB_P004944 [Saprochaete ingens]VVT56300.1 unnamed protein product [Saprochaete ingens]